MQPAPHIKPLARVFASCVLAALLSACVVYPDGEVAPAPGVGVGLADAGVAAADVGLAAGGFWGGWGGGSYEQNNYYNYNRYRPYRHWHKGGGYRGYRGGRFHGGGGRR